jgi:hypothetical protein
MYTDCLSENTKEIHYFGDLSKEWRIILKQILKIEAVDSTHLAEDREQWRALVNAIMHLGGP